MKAMKQQILERIERLGPGTVFTAKDFLDISSRGTADVTLSALVREGAIRRLQRGLYDSPKENPALGGTLSPDIDQSARALARRYRWNIVPDGPTLRWIPSWEGYFLVRTVMREKVGWWLGA